MSTAEAARPRRIGVHFQKFCPGITTGTAVSQHEKYNQFYTQLQSTPWRDHD